MIDTVDLVLSCVLFGAGEPFFDHDGVAIHHVFPIRIGACILGAIGATWGKEDMGERQKLDQKAQAYHPLLN